MNEQALNISTGRKYWIDVLRALGIILVVLGHVSKEPNMVVAGRVQFPPPLSALGSLGGNV